MGGHFARRLLRLGVRADRAAHGRRRWHNGQRHKCLAIRRQPHSRAALGYCRGRQNADRGREKLPDLCDQIGRHIFRGRCDRRLLESRNEHSALWCQWYRRAAIRVCTGRAFRCRGHIQDCTRKRRSELPGCRRKFICERGEHSSLPQQRHIGAALAAGKKHR